MQAIATSSLEQMREAEEKIVAAPLAAGPESSNGSKKQKKDKKKDKKRKDKKDKKSKKEKNNKPDCSEEMQSREVKRQATPQARKLVGQPPGLANANLPSCPAGCHCGRTA